MNQINNYNFSPNEISDLSLIEMENLNGGFSFWNALNRTLFIAETLQSPGLAIVYAVGVGVGYYCK